MIIYQKHLRKSISEYIFNFPQVWNKLKMKKWSRNHAFLFLLPLTSGRFESNWWQNPKTRLDFKPLGNKKKLAQINRNLRKKKELYLLIYHTSMFWFMLTDYCNKGATCRALHNERREFIVKICRWKDLVVLYLADDCRIESYDSSHMIFSRR